MPRILLRGVSSVFAGAPPGFGVQFDSFSVVAVSCRRSSAATAWPMAAGLGLLEVIAVVGSTPRPWREHGPGSRLTIQCSATAQELHPIASANQTGRNG